jgi:FkbM family methyltransferase
MTKVTEQHPIEVGAFRLGFAKLFVKVCRRAGLLKYLNLTVPTTINGRRLRIPLQGDLGYDNLTDSEPWMNSLLETLRAVIEQPDSLIVDVGVNIGQSLLKLRTVFPDVPYVGFEPNATCVTYAAQLIRVNDFRDATIFPFGVSNVAAVLQLQTYSDNLTDSSASIVADFRPAHKVFQRVNVPVFPLSAITLRGTVRLIKVDVEGGELEAAQGMRDLLERDRPLVLMEILPVYDTANVRRLERQREIENLFRQLKYRCYRIGKTASNGLDRLEPLSSIGIHSDVERSDYLWSPIEASPDVERFLRGGDTLPPEGLSPQMLSTLLRPSQQLYD